MKRRICVRSMGLGAGIMLIGLAVGAIVSPPLIAQRDDVFGDIQCTGLTVVDKQGNVAVALDTDEHGGVVNVYGKDGGSAGMRTDEHGGVVKVYRKDGGSAGMFIDEYGGSVSVTNNQGKIRAVMGINEFGNGAVSTWDKNGYRQ